jgi:hypothetical protein
MQMSIDGLPITNLLDEETALSAIKAGFVYIPWVPFFVNQHLPYDFVVAPPADPLPPEFGPLTVFKPGVYVRDARTIRKLLDKLNAGVL